MTEPSSAESADQTVAQLAQLSGTWEAPVVDGYLVDPGASIAAGNGADGGMPLHNAIPPLAHPGRRARALTAQAASGAA